MKLDIIHVFAGWICGVFASFNNTQGLLAVTITSTVLIAIIFFDDSMPINPTHIQYEGKRFKTLTQLIKYVKNGGAKE